MQMDQLRFPPPLVRKEGAYRGASIAPKPARVFPMKSKRVAMGKDGKLVFEITKAQRRADREPPRGSTDAHRMMVQLGSSREAAYSARTAEQRWQRWKVWLDWRDIVGPYEKNSITPDIVWDFGVWAIEERDWANGMKDLLSTVYSILIDRGELAAQAYGDAAHNNVRRSLCTLTKGESQYKAIPVAVNDVCRFPPGSLERRAAITWCSAGVRPATFESITTHMITKDATMPGTARIVAPQVKSNPQKGAFTFTASTEAISKDLFANPWSKQQTEALCTIMGVNRYAFRRTLALYYRVVCARMGFRDLVKIPKAIKNRIHLKLGWTTASPEFKKYSHDWEHFVKWPFPITRAAHYEVFLDQQHWRNQELSVRLTTNAPHRPPVGPPAACPTFSR